MTTMNASTSERVSVLDHLPPGANTSARNTDWILATDWRRLRFALNAAASTAAGTILVQRASAEAGTGAETASAATAWGGTSTTGDNVLTVIDIDPIKIATDEKPWLRVVVSATAGSTTAATLEGWNARYLPADKLNADDVVTVNSVDLPA